MKRILCSTGAVVSHRKGTQPAILPKIAPHLKCDGFEFMIYSALYASFASDIPRLAAEELAFPAVHCDKHIGEYIACGEENTAYELFELNCRIARMLGAELLVLHLWNGLISDSNFTASAKSYGTLCRIADKYGLSLTVENVVCNISTPLHRLCELKEEYPDIRFTLDTKMAEFHGELGLSCGCGLWSNIRHLHINDYGGGIKEWSRLRTLHPGDGHVDFDSFFGSVQSFGYSGDFTVEASAVADGGTVDIDKLNCDFDFIRGYIH